MPLSLYMRALFYPLEAQYIVLVSPEPPILE